MTYHTRCPGCWVVLEMSPIEDKFGCFEGVCEACEGHFWSYVLPGDLSSFQMEAMFDDSEMKASSTLRTRCFGSDSPQPWEENSHKGITRELAIEMVKTYEDWKASGNKRSNLYIWIDRVMHGEETSLQKIADELEQQGEEDRAAALAAGPPKWDVPEGATEVWSINCQCGGVFRVVTDEPQPHSWGWGECSSCGSKARVHWQMWSGEVGTTPGIFSTHTFDEEAEREKWEKFVTTDDQMRAKVFDVDPELGYARWDVITMRLADLRTILDAIPQRESCEYAPRGGCNYAVVSLVTELLWTLCGLSGDDVGLWEFFEGYCPKPWSTYCHLIAEGMVGIECNYLSPRLNCEDPKTRVRFAIGVEPDEDDVTRFERLMDGKVLIVINVYDLFDVVEKGVEKYRQELEGSREKQEMFLKRFAEETAEYDPCEGSLDNIEAIAALVPQPGDMVEFSKVEQ